MKLKLKIHDKDTDKLIDGDAIQNIEFSRDKPKCFYTNEEGYTVYTSNFEMIVEFLPSEDKMNPQPLDLKELLKARIQQIFDRYNYREDIERELRDLGFDIWALIDDKPDEQIWAYDKGTPNAHIVVFINWIDCFAWIFEKKKVIHL